MLNWLTEVLEGQKLKGTRGKIIAVIAFCCSCFFLYTAFSGSLPNIAQRATLMAFALPMIFLIKPSSQKHPRLSLVLDAGFAILAVVVFVYVIKVQKAIAWRVGNPNAVDMVMGVCAALLVIEAARRKVGWTLPILVGVLVIYGFAGPYMPGVLMHRGLDPGAFISSIYLSEEGIFGPPLQVAADFIMVFVLFGAFLRVSGAGEFFIDIADAAFGGMRGGPAKAAVISSGLMGCVSGSAVANVVTTGTFTIPMMKKTGYRPEVAGAVEAVSSTGGQIMSPIMGAAAFIMADFLRIPYWNVVKAAIIPAVLYYAAVFFMVDLEAAKTGLKGMPKSELPKAGEIMKRSGHLVIPVIVLIYLLGVVGYSAQKSAFFTIVLVVLVAALRKHTRINLRKFVSAMIEGAIGGLEVAAVCACAGIVIGILMRTGLGMMLTGMLVELSHGSLPILMVLTMIASIIMGMGLPTSACYIIVVVLIAPAMVQMGVPAIAAHMFAFYFACLSNITPPVAMAAYAGASIAGSDPMRTGFQATRVGACGFIVPFMFVYGTPLLMIGSAGEILLAFVTAMLGTFALSAGLTGYQFGKLNWFLRAMSLVAALVLIKPGIGSDLVGLAIIAVISAINWSQYKRKPKVPAA